MDKYLHRVISIYSNPTTEVTLIIGFYYSPMVKLEFGAKRSTVQTVALIEQKDINKV